MCPILLLPPNHLLGRFQWYFQSNTMTTDTGDGSVGCAMKLESFGRHLEGRFSTKFSRSRTRRLVGACMSIRQFITSGKCNIYICKANPSFICTSLIMFESSRSLISVVFLCWILYLYSWKITRCRSISLLSRRSFTRLLHQFGVN